MEIWKFNLLVEILFVTMLTVTNLQLINFDKHFGGGSKKPVDKED